MDTEQPVPAQNKREAAIYAFHAPKTLRPSANYLNGRTNVCTKKTRPKAGAYKI